MFLKGIGNVLHDQECPQINQHMTTYPSISSKSEGIKKVGRDNR